MFDSAIFKLLQIKSNWEGAKSIINQFNKLIYSSFREPYSIPVGTTFQSFGFVHLEQFSASKPTTALRFSKFRYQTTLNQFNQKGGRFRGLPSQAPAVGPRGNKPSAGHLLWCSQKEIF